MDRSMRNNRRPPRNFREVVDRESYRQWRWWRRTWLAMPLGFPAFFVGGVSGLAFQSDGYIRVFALTGLVWGLAIIPLVLEFARLFRRPGAELGASPTDRPATIATRPRWTMPQITSMGLALWFWPVGSIGVALYRGDTATALIIAPIALFISLLLAPVVLGQVRRGAVYLTPEGVHNVWLGIWWKVAWDDIDTAGNAAPLGLRAKWGATVERGRTSFFSWKGTNTWCEGLDMAIDVRWLSVGPSRLGAEIEHYRTHPEDRHKLGTPASLGEDNWRLRPDQLAAATTAGEQDSGIVGSAG